MSAASNTSLAADSTAERGHASSVGVNGWPLATGRASVNKHPELVLAQNFRGLGGG